MKSYLYIKWSVITLISLVFLSINSYSQSDTIFFVPVHEGVAKGTLITGLSYMGPAYKVNPDGGDPYFNETSFDVRFGGFVENKICVGVSVLSADYYDKNGNYENMLLYGVFTRLYQRDGSINIFLELEANYGHKKYVINGLDEKVDKKINGLFGFGVAWIDNSIMVELSVNANFRDHFNINLNDFIETNESGIFIQPRIGLNMYF